MAEYFDELSLNVVINNQLGPVFNEVLALDVQINAPFVVGPIPQHTMQGVVDDRIERLNNFRRTMADTQLALNPLAVEGTIIFNTRVLDTYNEGILQEEFRLTKRMLLSKTVDLHYVQDRRLADLLVENEVGAYILRLTVTSLPRIIAIDDKVIIAGITYTISKVSPYNRFNDSIIIALLYSSDSVPAIRDVADDADSDFYDTDNPNPDVPPVGYALVKYNGQTIATLAPNTVFNIVSDFGFTDFYITTP